MTLAEMSRQPMTAALVAALEVAMTNKTSAAARAALAVAEQAWRASDEVRMWGTRSQDQAKAAPWAPYKPSAVKAALQAHNQAYGGSDVAIAMYPGRGTGSYDRSQVVVD